MASPSSTTTSPPGKTPSTPTTGRSTGTSPPATPAPAYATSTPSIRGDGLLVAEAGHRGVQRRGHPRDLVDGLLRVGHRAGRRRGGRGDRGDFGSDPVGRLGRLADVAVHLGGRGRLLLHGRSDRRLRVVDHADDRGDLTDRPHRAAGVGLDR